MRPVTALAATAVLWAIAVPAQAAPDAAWCRALQEAPASPIRPTLLAPVAVELAPGGARLGAPWGVISQPLAEALAVDNMLLRIQLADCEALARSAPPASVANPEDPSAYKPRTEFDNKPWRFDMSQGGKRMTADEFDAWMKARGIRVAKGAPLTPAPQPAEPAPEPPGNK